MGSGKWLGSSRRNHPDFAWFPYVVRPENPEVEYAKVTQILGTQPADGSTPSPEASRPEGETPPENRPDDSRPTDSRPSGNTPSGAVPDEGTPNDAPPSGPQTPGQASGIQIEQRPEPLLLDPIDLVSLIASQTSDFALDVSVDRFDGGKYQAGDLVSVAGKSAKDGYLYLLAVDTEGVPSLLYPQPGDDNRVQGKTEFAIPSSKAAYQFRLLRPYGDYRIKAVVCEKPLEFSGLITGDPTQAATVQEEGAEQLPQKPDVALNQQKFRWNPTQREQVKALLSEYTSKGKLTSEQVDHVDCRAILGAFAQDEVAFYVGKARNASPNSPQKPRQ
jgi:hypothetical protein